MSPENTYCPVNRHVLLALDDSETAGRAVGYVIAMLGGMPEVKITLLTVVAIPPDDYFMSDQERDTWIREREERASETISLYAGRFIDAGFPESSVEGIVRTGRFPSVSGAIFAELERIGAGTIVVGRRGISKKDEFMYGSTSNKILHTKKPCACLWVVE